LNSNAERRWNLFAGVDFNRRSATAQKLRWRADFICRFTNIGHFMGFNPGMGNRV
jgi:hypothetical protein